MFKNVVCLNFYPVCKAEVDFTRLTELQIRGVVRKIFYLFLHENICCGYSLEAPWQGTSMCTHNICFLRRNKENISNFWLKKAMG